MTDDFEETLKDWLREQGATDPTEVDGLRAAIAVLPARRRRNRFVSVAAAAAVVLALGLAAIAVAPHSSGPGRGPGPLPPDPAAFAGDSRLARCGATVENALGIFEMAHARDYRLHLPAMGLSPELDVDAPAFVVVYRDRQPFGVSGAAPPPGQTWPPAPSLAPGHHDVCVLVGSDPSTAEVNVYGDVDIAGLTVAIDLTEPSSPTPSALPTPSAIASTGPSIAPAATTQPGCVRDGSHARPGVVDSRPAGWSYLTGISPAGFAKTAGVIYGPDGVAVPPDEGPNRLALYETFSTDTAYLKSRIEQSRRHGARPVAVEVCGESAEVWVNESTGELLLGWIDRDKSEVLVANTADFTVAELVRSAETVTDCCG